MSLTQDEDGEWRKWFRQGHACSNLRAMIWLTSPDITADALPAAWLIATGESPRNLIERSRLRRDMAQRIIARQLGLPAAAVTIGHDAQGRPLLEKPEGASLQLSLATRAGVVAVALANHPVGVDVERVDPAQEPPIAALHPVEAAALRGPPDSARPLAFARLWSAKEAYVKALGTGFARAPESFAVTFPTPDRFEVADALRGTIARGICHTIKNGGQEILAAAMIVLD